MIGVPIWWRGSIVGSCVVFTRDPDREFAHEDAELLELFAKHAAIANTNARLHEAAESEARAEAAAAERNRMAREVHDTVAQGLYGRAHDQLASRGINVGRSHVGEYCTSLDMAGCSVTLVKLDDELVSLFAAPAEVASRVF